MSITVGQTYRNSLDRVMVIKGYAAPVVNILGDIWIAESPDELFGPDNYLVTEQGLKDAGYALIATSP